MAYYIRNTSFIIALATAIGVFVSISAVKTLVLSICLLLSLIIILALSKWGSKTLQVLGRMLLISLFLLPGVAIGGIGLRFDDYLVVFMGLCLMLLIYHNRLTNISVVKWIFAYILYSVGITVIQIIINGLSPIYLFYLLKEIQYFIYFFIFLYVSIRLNDFNRFIKLLKILSFITMVWGLVQLSTGSLSGFYGIGIISEPASSQSGGVFFLITIFFLYLSDSSKRKGQKVKYGLLFVVSIALTLATISRTAILALAVVIIFYIIYTIIRMKFSAVKIFVSTYLLLFAVPIAYFFLKDSIVGIVDRLGRIGDGANTRIQHWDMFLSHSDSLGLIFGNGKGFMQTITGGFTLAADSQYVRLLIEVGWIGTILWAMVIISILLLSIRNQKKSYSECLFVLLATIGFLTMSITHEVFVVTMQASVYWSLMGIFVGKIIKRKKEDTSLLDATVE